MWTGLRRVEDSFISCEALEDVDPRALLGVRKALNIDFPPSPPLLAVVRVSNLKGTWVAAARTTRATQRATLR